MTSLKCNILFFSRRFACCPGLHVLPLARTVLMAARFHYDVILLQDAFGRPFFLGRPHSPPWPAGPDLCISHRVAFKIAREFSVQTASSIKGNNCLNIYLFFKWWKMYSSNYISNLEKHLTVGFPVIYSIELPSLGALWRFSNIHFCHSALLRCTSK